MRDRSRSGINAKSCHIRDVLISTTIRLHRGRTEGAPAVDPMFNDLRAELCRYNEANLTAVLEETAAAVAGLCEEISRMNEADWDRVVLRQPGEQRTTRWLGACHSRGSVRVVTIWCRPRYIFLLCRSRRPDGTFPCQEACARRVPHRSQSSQEDST